MNRKPLFFRVHYAIASSPHPCGFVTNARNAGHEPPASPRLSEITCIACKNWLKKHAGAWNAARAADHVAGKAQPISGGT